MIIVSGHGKIVINSENDDDLVYAFFSRHQHLLLGILLTRSTSRSLLRARDGRRKVKRNTCALQPKSERFWYHFMRYIYVLRHKEGEIDMLLLASSFENISQRFEEEEHRENSTSCHRYLSLLSCTNTV